jgi:recombination protein RecR
LIQQLSKLPGVGQKSAQRLAFFMLSLPQGEVDTMAQVMKDTRQRIRYCSACYNISYSDACFVCSNPKRNTHQLCVVAEPRDVFAIEKTQEYKGLYHVLGGLISPIDGVHPEALRIAELIQRIKQGHISELIFAINPTIEGDATVLYLTHVFQSLPIQKTRLAYGLPVGSDMDYADEMTLRKALTGRTPL